MSFIVVSYYTTDTLYEERAKAFRKSLLRYHIPFYIEEIESLGKWEDNINYKPTFLKQMMDKFAPKNTAVVWVDCDAVFHSYPILFDKLESDFAIHVWKRPPRRKEEMLSGTIFVGNTKRARDILDRWEQECKNRMSKKHPRSREQWDQQALAAVLEESEFEELPGEYCKIFDRMSEIRWPVIEHHQASRIVRKNSGALR